MPRLEDILTGRLLEEYREARDDPDAVRRLAEDIALFDAHLRLRLEVLASAGGSDNWVALLQDRWAAIEKARDSGDAAALGPLLLSLGDAIRRANEAKAVTSEMRQLITVRQGLAREQARQRSADIVRGNSPESRSTKGDLVRELALAGYSREQISRALGLSANAVTSRLRKWRALAREQHYDVREAVGEMRARFATRRKWLHGLRSAARGVWDVARLASEETRVDEAETDLLYKIGVLSVVTTSLMNEGALRDFEAMSTGEVEAQLSQRARQLAESVSAATSRPED